MPPASAGGCGFDGLSRRGFDGLSRRGSWRAGASGRRSLSLSKGLLALAGAGAAGLAIPAAGVAGLSRGRVLTRDEALSLPPGALPATALVLGTQVYADGQPSAFLRARLELARRLYEQGLVTRLLVSGASGPGHQDEPSAMRDWLLAAGIPHEAILCDHAGFDTYDSCVRARDVFGCRELTIVSQSFHLGRAVAICRMIGVDAVGVGDQTVRQYGTWGRHTMRERLANLKMVRDVGTRRDPLGGREA